MKRREIIKWAAVTPAVGAIVGSLVPFQSVFATPSLQSGPKRDLIKELGLRTFINAAGTYTTMTASLMDEEVMEAINASSQEFIMLNEVQDKVGEKIAKMVHSEAAVVTAGAFSALTLGMAGILTGMDQEKVKQLPHGLEEAGIKSEVIIQKAHFDGYEHALSNTGISLVPVETADDVDKAVNEKTASMHFLNCNTLEGKIKQKSGFNWQKSTICRPQSTSPPTCLRYPIFGSSTIWALVLWPFRVVRRYVARRVPGCLWVLRILSTAPKSIMLRMVAQ